MKKFLILLMVSFGLQITAQELVNYEKYISPNDSILLVNYPILKLPEVYKGPEAKDLPNYHNNSEHPYFRPIFSQFGWSCGQASSIGYNFTYEINRIKNTSAELPENQFPPSYTFNFFNKGIDAIGVGYAFSFNAIKANGNPNIVDYEGMGDDLSMWISGYDKYYNGMFNRINDIYSIYVGDEEGLQTLKYWMYDHLEGSPYGGLANFYTDLYGFTTFPPGSPEEGKAVITAFGTYNGHSMTFIGWNDTVQWDYNEDGEFTNDIDINNDGEVTMKDWEVGAVILANSWGDDWADSGYCYVMYNVLAQEKADGGIWNKQVNVITVKEDYEPLLTYKVLLTHDSRNKIKVIAGVSNDTSDIRPQFTMDLPIFDYQGGNFYMQGFEEEEHKTLEFGLDVTPLLSHINSGEPARFFLQIHENDPQNTGSGILNSFTLMDYESGGLAIDYPINDTPITENYYTTVSVTHSLTFDKVNITTEELPAFTSGQSYSQQMAAENGKEPYSWNISPVYFSSEHDSEYPEIMGQQVMVNGSQSGYKTQQLEFSFPFYDKIYDSVSIHVDGFIMFDEIPYPMPYQVNDMLLFESEPMIAAFLNKDIYLNSSSYNRIWYEGDETYAAFRWDATVVVDELHLPIDFAAILYPNGTIELYCDFLLLPSSGTPRITGISQGDGKNYVLSETTNIVPAESGHLAKFIPQNYPSEININEDGLLSFTPIEDDKIYTIEVKVTDYTEISDYQSYQISSGLTFDYSILSGADNQIDFGETAVLDFTVKNTGQETISDIILNVKCISPNVILLDSTEIVGTLNAGESILLEDAISFQMAEVIPDNYSFTLDIQLDSDVNLWESRLNLKAYAPALLLGTPVVDNETNRLEAGETVDIIIPVINNGHTDAEEVIVTIISSDPFITFNSSSELDYGTIPQGLTAFDTINVSVDESADIGHLVEFLVNITANPDISVDGSFNLVIGRYPALVIDLDPNMVSGPYIKFALEDLEVLHSYENFIPNDLNQYQNLFVVLGRNFSQHILTESEGQVLADFLDGGGNIYMEGGLTWWDDPQTVVHPMFNIIPEYVGWTQIDSIFGRTGSFADSLEFNYNGLYYYNYYLSPTGTGFPLLYNNYEDHDMAIASETENYKTIGTNIDFGGLIDGEVPSTRYHLMGRILQFFDMNVIISDIDDNPKISNDQEIKCLPNPFYNTLTLSFFMPKNDKISISISDIMGNIVLQNIVNKTVGPGPQEETINTSELKEGVYIITITTSKNSESLKVIKTN